MIDMKKYILILFLMLISCTTYNTKDLEVLDKQNALSSGKSIISIEWNYYGNQLYTIWIKEEDLNKDFAPFYWFTGNDKFSEKGPKSRNEVYMAHTPYSNKKRYFVVEPGTYILYDIHNQTIRPFSKAGQDWYIFTKTLGKGLEKIKNVIKENNYFAKFTVKAGEELHLPKVNVLYDGLNYVDKNSNNKDFVVEVFDNNGIYTFGNELKVKYIKTE